MTKKAKTEETEILEAKANEIPGEPEKKEDLEAKQAELTAKIDDLNNKYLRTLAEYDNYRKRTTKEKEELSLFVTAHTVKSFLAVYDNLERAVKAQPEDKGIELIFNQFYEVMKCLGVNEIEAEGKEFDPLLHNAVMHIDDENLGKNIICEVFQKGFILEETVIRHSMVKVAN